MPILPRDDEESVDPFTSEEIWNVVFDSDRNKSLDPDDFSTTLFQDNWDLIKVGLDEVFKEFFRIGILNCSMIERLV